MTRLHDSEDVGAPSSDACSLGTARPPPSERRRRAWFAAIVAAIVLAALVIRLPPLTAGMPYPSYIDEIFTLRPAAALIANRTWEPHAYNYPPLMMYATAAVSGGLHALPGGGSVGAGAHASLHQPNEANILSTDIIYAGRLVVLASATGTVLLAALLAARLAGRRAGVIAAVFTMVMPALVTRSAIVIVDTPAAFFTTASILCASHLRSRRSFLWAALAGSAAGLATATKYSAGAVIVVVLAVVALWYQRRPRDRLALACTSIAAAGLAAILAAPTLVFSRGAVLKSVRGLFDQYRTGDTETYWHQLFNTGEVGAPLVAVAVIGCIALLRSATTRPLMIGCTAFTVALVAPLVRYPFQPFRNMLPLLPFLAVAAAVGTVATVDAFGRLVHVRRVARAGLCAVVALVLCSMLVAGGRRDYLHRLVDLTNTRVAAREWLVEHTTGSDEVLVAGELSFLPSELALIPADVTVESLETPLGPQEAIGYDYVVTADNDSAKDWRPALVDRRVAVTYGVSKMMRRYFVHPGVVVKVFAAAGTQDREDCFPYCG